MSVEDGPLGADDVARRAGVDAAFVTDLVRHGILVPDAPGAYAVPDVWRVGLIRSMLDAGLTLDALSEGVKWLGDGVMCYFRDPGPAVLAALEMIDGIRDAGLPPAHVGVHTGPVVIQEGDYYGQTVNLAARIADYARPGEVLVSMPVCDAANDIGVRFDDIGDVELKGVAGSVHLFSAAVPAAIPVGGSAVGTAPNRTRRP